jgi:glutamate synthase domain-containing protein 1
MGYNLEKQEEQRRKRKGRQILEKMQHRGGTDGRKGE